MTKRIVNTSNRVLDFKTNKELVRYILSRGITHSKDISDHARLLGYDDVTEELVEQLRREINQEPPTQETPANGTQSETPSAPPPPNEATSSTRFSSKTEMVDYFLKKGFTSPTEIAREARLLGYEITPDHVSVIKGQLKRKNQPAKKPASAKAPKAPPTVKKALKRGPKRKGKGGRPKAVPTPTPPVETPKKEAAEKRAPFVTMDVLQKVKELADRIGKESFHQLVDLFHSK